MLVLSRKCGEACRLSGGILVKVLGISSNGEVKLGIDAPRHVAIHREEVNDHILRFGPVRSDFKAA